MLSMCAHLAVAVAADCVVDGDLGDEHQQREDDGAGEQAEVDLPCTQLLLAILTEEGFGLRPVCGLCGRQGVLLEAGGGTTSNLEFGVPDLPGHGNCRVILLRGVSHAGTRVDVGIGGCSKLRGHARRRAHCVGRSVTCCCTAYAICDVPSLSGYRTAGSSAHDGRNKDYGRRSWDVPTRVVNQPYDNEFAITQIMQVVYKTLLCLPQGWPLTSPALPLLIEALDLAAALRRRK